MSGRASAWPPSSTSPASSSIPQDYYEAARIDGAGAWQNFWHITLPLVRPATVTVIILSLIGGLRSFDLIWAMTRGGPGFTSDVIASVIYKQYQAGFYGLSTAGNVVLFVLVAAIVVPLSRCLNRKEVELNEPARRYWLSGARRSSLSAVVFLVPFAFIVLTAVQGPASRRRCSTSRWPQQFHFWDNLVEVVAGPRLHAGHRLHQLHDPDRGQRRPAGGPGGDGRLRAAAPARAGGTAWSTSWSWPG